MKRILAPLVLILVLASCSGDDTSGTSTVVTAPTTTSTTMDIEVCEDLAEDAVAWVEDLVRELDGISYEVLTDRTRWSDGLIRVDEEGGALQAESDAAGCDESLLRGAVVDAASRMESDSATARLLLDLLAPGSTP